MATLADQAKIFFLAGVTALRSSAACIERRGPVKAPLHLYTRPNIAEWPAPSLLPSSVVSPRPSAVSSSSPAAPRVPERILKKADRPLLTALRRVLVRRPEETLPVTAVLAVRGGWPKRGTPLHTAARSAATQGLLAEEWLAARDCR